MRSTEISEHQFHVSRTSRLHFLPNWLAFPHFWQALPSQMNGSNAWSEFVSFARLRRQGRPRFRQGIGRAARGESPFVAELTHGPAVLWKWQPIVFTRTDYGVLPPKIREGQGATIFSTDISADIMSTDKDTLFPLQGAFGYDLMQHLLIGPNNLLVEGPSDHTYLLVFSDWLKEKGRTGLDDRFSVVVAGALARFCSECFRCCIRSASASAVS
jgi:hypothetical protein